MKLLTYTYEGKTLPGFLDGSGTGIVPCGEAGLPAQVSNTAGNFCCNMVMYSALNYIAKHKLNARAGFVHVPYTPEMVAKKAEQLSTMSFENMKRAVEVVAKASVDYEQDISLVCGACS